MTSEEFKEHCIEKNLLIELVEHINEEFGRKMYSRHMLGEFVSVIGTLRRGELNYEWDCVRQCTKCGKVMWEGHYVDEAYEYYCSDKCLDETYTEEEKEELYKEDLLWFTEWI